MNRLIWFRIVTVCALGYNFFIIIIMLLSSFAFEITVPVYHKQGAGTTEGTLTEIFASRSNRQIKAISEAYLAGLYHSNVLLILQMTVLHNLLRKSWLDLHYPRCLIILQFFVLCCVIPETGRSIIHDLQSEVSGDYGKALLTLAEVLWSSNVLSEIWRKSESDPEL